MLKIVSLLVIAALACGAAPAHAGGIINIGQAFSNAIGPYIDATVQALIAAVVLWAAAKFKQKTGIEIDAAHRDAFTRALQNQASSLIADGKARLDGVTVKVDSLALANAVNDLLGSVPDAVAHFGITPDFVAKRIVDMIPQIAPVSAPPSIGPVNVSVVK